MTEDLKCKIKSRGGVLVAKASKSKNESSNITWRATVSHVDLFTKDTYSGCNVNEVLVILKDLRLVGLSKFSKDDLFSYCIKSTLLWCMEEVQKLNKSELVGFTLQKLSFFYNETVIPDFFDEQCNLIRHVPKTVAKEIGLAIENIRENIVPFLAECEARQRISKIAHKEKFLRLGIIKKFHLKMLIKLGRLFPSICRYIFLRIALPCFIGLGFQEEAVKFLSENDDPKFNELIEKLMLGIFNNITEALS